MEPNLKNKFIHFIFIIKHFLRHIFNILIADLIFFDLNQHFNMYKC